MRGTRLTRSGVALAIGAAMLLVAGRLTHYRELVLLGLLAAGIVAVAILVPRVSSRVDLSRRLSRRMLQRGDELEVTLRIKSHGPLSGLRIIDRLDDIGIPIEIAYLERDRAIDARYTVRPRVRGVRVLGPVGEERTDPFGLAVRTLEHQEVDEIMVHPVVHALGPSPHGMLVRQQALARRRMSEDPLADFRSLRAYVPGDDPRRIHWPSTARTGMPVVRDFLEQQQSLRLVLLETADDTIGPILFEEAVEIAASLVLDAWEQGLACVSRTRDVEAIGPPSVVKDANDVLVQYTRVRRTARVETADPLHVLNGLPAVDQVYCVTGADSPLLHSLVTRTQYRPYVHAIQVVGEASMARHLAVRSIAVRTAEEFAARWRAGQYR